MGKTKIESLIELEKKNLEVRERTFARLLKVMQDRYKRTGKTELEFSYKANWYVVQLSKDESNEYTCVSFLEKYTDAQEFVNSKFIARESNLEDELLVDLMEEV